MSTCEKCGRVSELAGDEAHDCVEYLKGVIAEMEERHQEEIDGAHQDSENAYHRAHEAGLRADRAHADARHAEELRANEKAACRRREQKAEDDRQWSRITGRRSP